MYGWGYTSQGGKQSVDLLEVSVPVTSKEKCSQFLKNKLGVTMHDGQICAGGEKGKDACQVKYSLKEVYHTSLDAVQLKAKRENWYQSSF